MHRTDDLFNSHVMPPSTPNFLNWKRKSSEFPQAYSELDNLYTIWEQWISYLKLLCCRKELENPLTEDQIHSFAQYLVYRQNTDTHPDYKGSWNLIPIGSTPDKVVEFIFFPSYIALAYLVIVKRDYPQIEKTIQGFSKCLDYAFEFTAKRDFRGTGYDCVIDLIFAVDILYLGGVFSYARAHQKRHWRFFRAMSVARRRITDNINERPMWGSVDIKDADRALKLLGGEDSDIDVIKEIAYRDWYVRRNTPFRTDLVSEVSQLILDRFYDDIKQSILSVQEGVAQELDELMPEYTVFKRRRAVETSSHQINTNANVRDLKNNLRSYMTYIPKDWLFDRFDEILVHIKVDIERELLKKLVNLKVVESAPDFEIRISNVSVTDDGGVTFGVIGRSL